MDITLPEISLDCRVQDWRSVIVRSDSASDADEVEYWDSLNDFTGVEEAIDLNVKEQFCQMLPEHMCELAQARGPSFVEDVANFAD
uniref:Uncharacterized protein n=1 Tax=Sphaerodactylus townsendi TaxID=933632 RepID=A0ACB8ER26_9SAUR